jgi:uncharacterized protein (DUF983 family)
MYLPSHGSQCSQCRLDYFTRVSKHFDILFFSLVVLVIVIATAATVTRRKKVRHYVHVYTYVCTIIYPLESVTHIAAYNETHTRVNFFYLRVGTGLSIIAGCFV